MRRIAWLFLLSAWLASPASATTRHAGAGQTYTTVTAAAAACANNDSVIVHGNQTYHQDWPIWNKTGLKIIGVDANWQFPGTALYNATQAPIMDGDLVFPNQGGGGGDADKGIWVLTTAADNIEIKGISFKRARSSGANGAGIRIYTTVPATNLLIQYCKFEDCEDGILGGSSGDSIRVEYSEFLSNGTVDAQAHNMYIGNCRSFTLRYSYTHKSIGGHLIKTRALNNYIEYNRITQEDGTGSYEVDIPDGGRSFVIGNVIEQGANAGNSRLVRYAEESTTNPSQELYVFNNTFANEFSTATYVQVAGTPAFQIKNCIFYGLGSVSSGGSPTTSNNYQENPQANTAKFVNPSGYDYRLTAATPSTVLNAGVDPGTVSGKNCLPTNQYVYDKQTATRTTSGSAVDIGAFEFSQTGGSPDACTPPF